MNVYYFGSALNLSALYMIAGSGAALSIKSGEINLGGEGQIYLGGFISAVLLGLFSGGASAHILALALAFTIPALVTLFSAFLKKVRGADFLFTSFIASAAIIPFIDGLIAGPARSKTENLLATAFIAPGFRLRQLLPPSPLNASFIAALILCLGLWTAAKSGDIHKVSADLYSGEFDASGAFTRFDEASHSWVVDPGEWKVLVGSSSADIRWEGTLNVK